MLAGAGKITPNLEDYLEAIHRIIVEKGAVRACDIAERLGVSRPSVTGRLRVLSKKGLVNYAPYDVITLTPEGEAIAHKVDVRHRVLRNFLTEVLKINGDEADAAACRMEHALTPSIRRRLEKFVKDHRSTRTKRKERNK